MNSDTSLLREIHRDGVDAGERAALAEGRLAPVILWIRAAHSPLVRLQLSGRVTRSRPPREQPGEVFATFDASGRLSSLETVPDASLTDEGNRPDQTSEDAWPLIAAATGLDPDAFQPTTPRWAPPHYVDRVLAWQQTCETADTKVSRVEAGFRGATVATIRTLRGFEDVTTESASSSGQSAVSQTVNVLLILSVLAGGAILARRNTHLGRVDSRGALRVATFIFGLDLVVWLLRADHAIGAGNEFELFVLACGGALFNGAFVWLLYMALEPEVRRHWPQRLISWERLVTRNGRDPLVGRHLLAGLMIGLGLTVMLSFVGWLLWAHFEPHSETLASGISLMTGARHAIGAVLKHLSNAVFAGFFITVLVLLGRLVMRRTWAAVLLTSLIFVGLNALQSDPWYVSAAISAVLLVAVMVSLLRFGLLSLAVTIFVLNLFQSAPLVLSWHGWQGTVAALPSLFVLALSLVAFRLALGNQSLIAMD